jgi:adenylate kinase family enzyme
MKIYILGAAGSGKTTLAKSISRKLEIESTNLDDLFWENNRNYYGIKRNQIERDELYNAVLEKESWIIEGAYIEWPKKGFYKADKVLYLNIPKSIICFRILRRFVYRKIGIEKSDKKESLLGIYRLLKWNRDQIIETKKSVQKLNTEIRNIVELRNKKEIEEYLNTI